MTTLIWRVLDLPNYPRKRIWIITTLVTTNQVPVQVCYMTFAAYPRAWITNWSNKITNWDQETLAFQRLQHISSGRSNKFEKPDRSSALLSGNDHILNRRQYCFWSIMAYQVLAQHCKKSWKYHIKQRKYVCRVLCRIFFSHLASAAYLALQRIKTDGMPLQILISISFG